MNILKIFFWLTLFSIFTFSNACWVTWKISQCNWEVKQFVQENENWEAYIIPWWSLKHIEDFICLQDSKETRLFQIVLDDVFKEIDDEMDTFLFDFEKAKWTFFSEWSWSNYIEWINFTWEMSDYFEDKYREACSKTIIEDVVSCKSTQTYKNWEWLEDDETISHEAYTEHMKSCNKLVDVKIAIFRDITFNTLMLNKEQVLEDNKKKYDIEQRKKYDELLDLMMINYWYIERLRRKWPNKIKNSY